MVILKQDLFIGFVKCKMYLRFLD